MPKLQAPCRPDCPNRSVEPNCHHVDRCEKWKAYQEKYEREKSALRKAREREAEESSYIIASIKRNKKRLWR